MAYGQKRPQDRRDQKTNEGQLDLVIGVNLTGATLMVRDTVAKMAETAKGVAKHVFIARHETVVNLTTLRRVCARGDKNLVHGVCKIGFALVRLHRMIETPMTRGMNQKHGCLSWNDSRRSYRTRYIWTAVKFVIECEY